MKSLLTLFILSLLNYMAHGQVTPKEFNLSEFTAFRSSELNFNQIVTDSSYLYWRCLSTNAHLKKGQEQLVAEYGESKYARLTKRKYSSNGFLLACGPGFCYNYIVAVKRDKTIEMIVNDTQLKVFIGKVDNIEEVKILARANGLYINLKGISTGSYRKHGNDYLLYLFDSLQSCLPGDVQDDQSIKAMLTAKGEFKLMDRSF